MNITECKKLIASMMAVYENYNPKDPEFTAKMWADVMPDYSYKQADTALRNYIRSSTSGFAPTPGQIIDIIHTMTTPQELNEMEAWAVVRKAIGRSSYYATEEFTKFPPLVQKAVGSADQLRVWALDEDFSESVVMSNFQRAYRVVLDREKEISKMPENVRILIKKTCEHSPAAMLEQKRQKTIDRANSISLPGPVADKGIPMPDKYKGISKQIKEGYCDGSISSSVKG